MVSTFPAPSARAGGSVGGAAPEHEARPERCGGEVRGRYMELLLEHVDRLPELDACAIRRAAGVEVLADIKDAGPVGWVPVEHHLEVVRAVSIRLGPRRTHDFFVALGHAACERAPLQSLVQAVQRGPRGPAVLAFLSIPKAKALLVRDAGVWALSQHGPGTATLEVTQLPACLARDVVWTHSVASELHAWLSVAEVRGTVTLQDASVPRRRASFRLRWT